METFISMDFLLTYFLLIFSFLWICIISNSRARKLPPGPYGLPIIGNILNLGPEPHQSLAKLSRKYGPVISLKLGSVATVVVSSPETARIVLQKHDSSFSSRYVPGAADSLSHGEFSMLWLPVGNQWRKLRKICREQLLSVARLDAREGLRREKMQKLRDYLGECCRTGRAVDVGSAAFTTSLNVMSASLFSVDFAQFDSDSSQELKDFVSGLLKCWGSPNLCDFFPVLKCIDPQGLLKQSSFYFGKLFAIFDEIIQERMKSMGEKDDLVQALIDISQRDEDELTMNDIKHLLMDLFLAGTETTSGTVEWAMAELIGHPTKMAILRNEVRNLIKENGELQESDIPRLPYLQAVVKETLRLHPVGPLMVPHKAESDNQINGYIIPKNTQILVNVWAIGRDPNVWANATEFMPERFLNQNNSLEFTGHDFEFIPFGSGRRICPGLQFANRMVGRMLATFVTNFEWKIKPEEEMDMSEKYGLTLQKAVPLVAVPVEP